MAIPIVALTTGLTYHVLAWDGGGDHTVVLVHGFLDLAWAWYAGADPLDVLRQASGRVPLLHVKDLRRADGPVFVVLGEGEERYQRLWMTLAAAQAFCADCGTQLYATEPDVPKTINFRLGCVNERAELTPVVQIWGQSAMAWVNTLSAVPCHAMGLNSARMDASSLPSTAP